MNNRALALDALRGYAIITMVLSATIVTHVLPGWMSHAQTPPPDHVFNPLLPGITWVDLVFPFFLFAMGAAFPFSIRKRAEKGDSKLKLVYEAVKRGIQLTFFAIFIQHFLSVYVKFSAGYQSMAAGYTLFCCSISHVHAHSFENAGLGTYFNKSGSLHCRCHYVGYHFLCGWENIQFILQQHYHFAVG